MIKTKNHKLFSCLFLSNNIHCDMKHVLYEVTDNWDIIIKLTFENYTYLNAFIEQHTADKKYEPKFLVLEVNDEGDIDFLRVYNGVKETSKKYVVDFID